MSRFHENRNGLAIAAGTSAPRSQATLTDRGSRNDLGRLSKSPPLLRRRR
jgi:hypothetical protein